MTAKGYRRRTDNVLKYAPTCVCVCTNARKPNLEVSFSRSTSRGECRFLFAQPTQLADDYREAERKTSRCRELFFSDARAQVHTRARSFLSPIIAGGGHRKTSMGARWHTEKRRFKLSPRKRTLPPNARKQKARDAISINNCLLIAPRAIGRPRVKSGGRVSLRTMSRANDIAIIGTKSERCGVC